MKKIDSFFIQKICIFYIIIWAISPIMAYGLFYRLLAIIFSLIWLFVESIRPNNIFKKPSKLVVYVLIFLAFQISMKLLVPDQFTFLSYFQLYIFFLFALMGESLRKRNYRDIYQILLLVIILMPIWMITTNIAVENMIGSDGSTVTRVLAKSSDESRMLTKKGVGGYGMIYFLVLYLPCIFYLIRNFNRITFDSIKNRNLVMLFLLVNYLLGIYTVFKADYVIALILMVIGIYFSLLYNAQSKLKQLIFWGFGFSFLFVVLPLVILRNINYLAELFWGTSLHRKLVDIQISLVSGSSKGTVSDRTDRYLRSWNYFLDNIITGTLKKDNLGKHSLILDMFAQYGVFIGLFFCVVLLYIFFRSNREHVQKNNLHITVGLLFFLICLLNNIGAIIGVAVFFVYPGVLMIVKNRKVRI